MKAPLFLLRHARPLIAKGLCYGQLDIPADHAHTLSSAQAMAQQLRQAGFPQVQLVASPLRRCQQLAHALSHELHTYNIPHHWHSDTRLQEMDFGVWEGLPWSTIALDAWQAWTADFAHFRVGETGESVAQLMARVHHALQTPRHLPTVWITHDGVIKSVQLLQQQRQPQQASDWPRTGCAYGQSWCCTSELLGRAAR